MKKPDFNDYESTGQWMVASVLAGRIEDSGRHDPLPTPKEISDAIDGANSGTALGEYIGAAWEAAGEIVYDKFPRFRDCEHDEVKPDDDGKDGRWFVCTSCDQIVELSDPDEDGKSYWEVMR